MITTTPHLLLAIVFVEAFKCGFKVLVAVLLLIGVVGRVVAALEVLLAVFVELFVVAAAVGGLFFDPGPGVELGVGELRVVEGIVVFKLFDVGHGHIWGGGTFFFEQKTPVFIVQLLLGVRDFLDGVAVDEAQLIPIITTQLLLLCRALIRIGVGLQTGRHSAELLLALGLHLPILAGQRL